MRGRGLVCGVGLSAVLLIGGCGDGDEGPTCDPGQVGCGAPCTFDVDCGEGEVCSTSNVQTGVCQKPVDGRPALDLVLVPSGTFYMGCEAAQGTECELAESPRRQVNVPVYRIDRTEVTNAGFAAFLSDRESNACGEDLCMTDTHGAFPLEPSDGGWAPKAGLANHPAVTVTWYGALAYCEWRGQTLCTEAQWEKAARGGCELVEGACEDAQRRYTWGEADADCTRAHMFDSDEGCGTGATAAVGSYPDGAGPYGTLDQAGNVWEWVMDHWHEGYDGAPIDGSSWDDPASQWRVFRGGGAGSGDKWFRLSARGNGAPEDEHAFRGFRCCAWGEQ